MRNTKRRPATWARTVQVATVMLFLTGGSSAVLANQIKVTTDEDASYFPGDCTLRDAIANANMKGNVAQSPCSKGSGDDEIVFNDDVFTIQLKTGNSLNVIGDTKLTISGPITIDGYDSTRVFYLGNEAALVLDDVSVRYGFTTGGGAGLLMEGAASQLTIKDGSFENCVAEGNGGALQLSAGTVSLNNTRFENNTAAYGGAIDTGGVFVSVSKTIFRLNSARWGGGAINCTSNELGHMIMNSSSFLENGSVGILDPSTLAPIGGGAIMNKCLMEAFDTSFEDNTTWGSGGAIHNLSGSDGLSLTRTAFSFNHAGGETEGGGGAIFAQGPTTIVQSGFEGNSGSWKGGGAIYVGDTQSAPVIVANSTFNENSADGPFYTGHGGGVFFSGKVHNAVFYNNTFSESFGLSSIYIDPSNSSPSTQIVWANNLIETYQTLGCAGNQSGFALGANNTQWPDSSGCAGMAMVDSELGAPQYSADNRVYLTPAATAAQLVGAISICQAVPVNTVDELDNVRFTCNVGAIHVP